MQTITLQVRPEDAEPILRENAEAAAKYSAWLDHITCRTYNPPSNPTVETRAEWNRKFLRAKRIVEAFGVEYEATTEAETLGTHIPDKILKSHLVTVAGMTFRHVDEHRPDPKRAMPSYRGGIHAEACRQAAARVVRRWKETTLVL